MTRYLIKRNVGAAASQDYIDAAVVRAITCAYSIDGLKWVTSYWDTTAGFTYCVYDAESEADIIEHSRRASIGCDEIIRVESIDPAQYSGAASAKEVAAS